VTELRVPLNPPLQARDLFFKLKKGTSIEVLEVEEV
jgi:hypothetical protein